MALYETNKQAAQDLVKKLYKASAELKPIYDSTNKKDQARASELKSEIEKIQNQLMMSSEGISGGIGALGGGVAKGVTGLFTAIPDIAVAGYDYFRKPTMSELVTGKQPTKGVIGTSEWLTPGIESVSQENAGMFGLGKGVGSSLGLGPKMAAANMGAAWFDEYLAKGTPLAQTALAAGSLLEAGRRGVYKYLQSRSAKQFLSQFPEEDASIVREWMAKGQDTTDPVLAGKISALRANPKYAEFFNKFQAEAGKEIVKGLKAEVSPYYPTQETGSRTAESIAAASDKLKSRIYTDGKIAYDRAAHLAGDTPIVDVTNVRGKIAAMIKEYESGAPTSDTKATLKFLRGLDDELLQNVSTDRQFIETATTNVPKISVPQLQAWLTDFGKKARGADTLITDVSLGTQKRIASQIFGGLKDDLDVLASSKDSVLAGVGKALQSGSEATRKAADRYNNFISQGLPEILTNRSLASIDNDEMIKIIDGLSNKQRSVVAGILEKDSPQTWQYIKQRTFDDLMSDVRTAPGQTTGDIDLKKLVDKWNSFDAPTKEKYAIAMGTSVADFDGRMKDANKFFNYAQQYAGDVSAGKIDKALAEQGGFALFGGSYTGSKIAGMVASAYNQLKGGLTNEQTMNLLFSPEQRSTFKELVTNPNSVKTLEKINNAFDQNIGEAFRNSIGMGYRAAESAATKPVKASVEVSGYNPVTSFGGIDFSSPDDTTDGQQNKSTSPFGGVDFSAPAGSLDISFNSLTKEQQDRLLKAQFGSEGSKPGNLAHDLNNPGAMVYVGGWQNQFGAKPGKTVTGPDGKTRTFAAFPDAATGMEAQRHLWSTKYGNVPMSQALQSWVDPHDATQFENYKNTILASLD